MLPDERLRDLLQRAEDQARPDPVFLERLFDDLGSHRRHRSSQWLQLPRPVATFAALAPLVLVVAVVGILVLGIKLRPGLDVGGQQSPAPVSLAPVARQLCSAGCDLAAGTYTTAPMVPAFTFTIGGGWSNPLHDVTGDEIELLSPNGSQPAPQMFWLVNAQGRNQSGQLVPLPPTADALISYLGQLSGATAGGPVSVIVDGAPARQMDLSSTAHNNFVLVTTSPSGAGGLVLPFQATTRARFVIVEKAGTTVTIVTLGDAGTGFDAAVAATEPILASIKWQ